MQTIELQQTVTITIPEDQILIEKTLYEGLVSDSLAGKTWGAAEVTARLNGKVKRDWEVIFYKYREQLDVLNGGFVRFPKGSGTSWKFKAKETADFIDSHWRELVEAKRIS